MHRNDFICYLRRARLLFGLSTPHRKEEGNVVSFKKFWTWVGVNTQKGFSCDTLYSQSRVFGWFSCERPHAMRRRYEYLEGRTADN
jgi:hypothetical protein